MTDRVTPGERRRQTPIEVCEQEGHTPTIGLRHDLMRQAMVADCTRCGAVLMLDQTRAPVSVPSQEETE